MIWILLGLGIAGLLIAYGIRATRRADAQLSKVGSARAEYVRKESALGTAYGIAESRAVQDRKTTVIQQPPRQTVIVQNPVTGYDPLLDPLNPLSPISPYNPIYDMPETCHHDPAPAYDAPSCDSSAYDAGSSCDSGSSYDSGSSDCGGFD